MCILWDKRLHLFRKNRSYPNSYPDIKIIPTSLYCEDATDEL